MTDVDTGGPAGPQDRTEPVDIQVEMQRSYIDYAMSVIVGRALPDVRDGLKPVHTRILWAMYDGGYRPDRGYFKCSRVVGDVMGQYHPHGDSAIYDALVRLAQPWSMRMPLIDSQGNFGSPGNDPAAAMRYTEARLTPLAMEMLRDIDEETVDFIPNYDGRVQEPTVLAPRPPRTKPAFVAWAVAATVAAVSFVGWFALQDYTGNDGAMVRMASDAGNAQFRRVSNVKDYVAAHQQFAPAMGMEYTRPYIRNASAQDQPQ